MGQNMTKPMIEGMAGVMMSSDTQDLWPVATTLLRISTLNCRILIMITAVRWMSYLKYLEITCVGRMSYNANHGWNGHISTTLMNNGLTAAPKRQGHAVSRQCSRMSWFRDVGSWHPFPNRKIMGSLPIVFCKIWEVLFSRHFIILLLGSFCLCSEITFRNIKK